MLSLSLSLSGVSVSAQVIRLSKSLAASTDLHELSLIREVVRAHKGAEKSIGLALRVRLPFHHEHGLTVYSSARASTARHGNGRPQVRNHLRPPPELVLALEDALVTEGILPTPWSAAHDVQGWEAARGPRSAPFDPRFAALSCPSPRPPGHRGLDPVLQFFSAAALSLSQKTQTSAIPSPLKPTPRIIRPQAWNAITGVWASKWNERAFTACRKARLDHNDLSMAVLAQRVVPARYAFVIHTVNPISKDAGEIYCELVCGLGETLVGAYPGRALSFVARKAGGGVEAPQLKGFPSKRSGLFLREDTLIFRRAGGRSAADDAHLCVGLSLPTLLLLLLPQVGGAARSKRAPEPLPSLRRLSSPQVRLQRGGSRGLRGRGPLRFDHHEGVRFGRPRYVRPRAQLVDACYACHSPRVCSARR